MSDRYLVVTRHSLGGELPNLDAYLYGHSTLVESWKLERDGQPIGMDIVQVTADTEDRVYYLADYQTGRLESGLFTVWTMAGDLEAAKAETVVVRATLGV